MRKLSEGNKMFLIVMAIFVAYGAFFILFEDYDRLLLAPLADKMDWHLLWGSVAVLAALAIVLLRYSKRMDERISREQAEIENNMRRQLTQNIAHELKTPVASILGYTETLIDNPDIDAGTRQQFISRTHAQAERLTSLLTDISILNRMDYAAQMFDKKRCDISEIVADIVEETAPTLEKRNMTLHNCLPEDIVINANPQLIYSIFHNLIDNAINYAGQNTCITITAAENTPRQWQFCVSDNGTGIPSEHLGRLFERFYRVDRGRSREMGGTGLGLAIVKNAVVLHGGTITAQANPEGGVAFRFTLSKT